MARKTVAERFWLFVTRGAVDECWEWKGCRQRGYGVFGVDGKNVRPHRWLYERERGPVPKGLQLDHLCRNRACVNPTHLEPVTRKENILRGVCPSALNAVKTHCPKGHPLSGDNVKIKPTSKGRPGMYRACRTCAREQMFAKRHREGGIWQGNLSASARTHCPKGHLYDGIEGGRRMCRMCRREQKRQRYQRTQSKGKGLPSMRTHCPHGHAYAGDNLLSYRGRRICRECRRLLDARQYAKAKAMRLAIRARVTSA